MQEKEMDETLTVTSLNHTMQVPVEKKDFAKEIRAMKDIKDFLENSEILLDCPETSLEPLIDRLLDKMFDNDDRENVSKEELKSTIFADDSKTRLKESLQGIVSRDEIYDWEQTW